MGTRSAKQSSRLDSTLDPEKGAPMTLLRPNSYPEAEPWWRHPTNTCFTDRPEVLMRLLLDGAAGILNTNRRCFLLTSNYLRPSDGLVLKTGAA